MSETGAEEPGEPRGARALVEEKRSLSLVWLIPLVAALAGGWLAYKAMSERGPEVRIVLDSAAGLEAGKTKVKYKDVQVGLVERIELADDLRVEVFARLTRDAEPYLTENTRFWVVRAELRAGEVTALGTLFSGAYIGMDPATEGEPRFEFEALPSAPVFTSEDPGSYYVLRSRGQGGVQVGAPVYFRRFEVGRVAESKLDESGDFATVRIFVRAPHDARVRRNTRFWNAGGVDLSLSPEGLQLETVSLTSLLIGGVSFDVPEGESPGPLATPESLFTLFPNRKATTLADLTISRPFLLYFDQSVAGLVAGAPVTFRGIQVGEVRNVRLVVDEEAGSLHIPVEIAIQPERIAFGDATVISLTPEEVREEWDSLVARGMRAQLGSGNLLTGALAVAMDFHPDAPEARIDWDQPVPVLPTIPSPIEELKTGVAQFVKKLDAVPLEEIGDNLNATLVELRALSEGLNSELTPALVATLEDLDTTLSSANQLVAPDSPTAVQLRRMLLELTEAAQALRLLAEELERNPESLLRGKGGG